jgi:hypothetical protein
MDHDQYEDTVTNECLQEHDETPQEFDPLGTPTAGGEGQGKSTIYDSQSSYNPFDIHMGQMTVYRLHITCSCSASEETNNEAPFSTPNSNQNSNKTSGSIKAKASDDGSSSGGTSTTKRCAQILPLKDQPWSAYMGSHADSYFPRRSDSFPSSSPPSPVLSNSVKTSTLTPQMS